MRHTTLLSLVAALTLTAQAVAQERPDFSGVWKLEPRGSSTTISITVAHSAGELKIDRLVETEGRKEVLTFVYKLDGSESINELHGAIYRSTAAWDGAVLVLDSVVTKDGAPLGKIREAYRLERGDLTVEHSLTNFRGTFSGKHVYKKQAHRPQ